MQTKKEINKKNRMAVSLQSGEICCCLVISLDFLIFSSQFSVAVVTNMSDRPLLMEGDCTGHLLEAT